MINIFAALEIAEAAAEKQSIGVTLADVKTLYGVYSNAKAGKLDIGAMVKAGTLAPAIEAGARTLTLADGLLKDKTEGPKVVALMESILGD